MSDWNVCVRFSDLLLTRGHENKRRRAVEWGLLVVGLIYSWDVIAPLWSRQAWWSSNQISSLDLMLDTQHQYPVTAYIQVLYDHILCDVHDLLHCGTGLLLLLTLVKMKTTYCDCFVIISCINARIRRIVNAIMLTMSSMPQTHL